DAVGESRGAGGRAVAARGSSAVDRRIAFRRSAGEDFVRRPALGAGARRPRFSRGHVRGRILGNRHSKRGSRNGGIAWLDGVRVGGRLAATSPAAGGVSSTHARY